MLEAAHSLRLTPSLCSAAHQSYGLTTGKDGPGHCSFCAAFFSIVDKTTQILILLTAAKCNEFITDFIS